MENEGLKIIILKISSSKASKALKLEFFFVSLVVAKRRLDVMSPVTFSAKETPRAISRVCCVQSLDGDVSRGYEQSSLVSIVDLVEYIRCTEPIVIADSVLEPNTGQILGSGRYTGKKEEMNEV